jgi:glutathione S-transferase
VSVAGGRLTLVIGNRNYSSWSLRPWLALAMTGQPFDEVRIALHQPDSAERIGQYSAAGKVPVLIDGATRVWESLAICEYIAERFPEAGLWPQESSARALARAVAHEMHAGFAALRRELPMNVRADRPGLSMSAEAQADIARVLGLWAQLRERYGAHGPFLFGRFSIADAMYAPVVLRFRTYHVDTAAAGVAAYCAAILGLEPLQRWVEDARAEPEHIAAYER